LDRAGATAVIDTGTAALSQEANIGQAVTVQGTGFWQNTTSNGNFFVGDTVSVGTLNVTDAGSLTVGALFLGYSGNLGGQVNMNGNSTLTAGRGFYIGTNSASTLTLAGTSHLTSNFGGIIGALATVAIKDSAVAEITSSNLRVVGGAKTSVIDGTFKSKGTYIGGDIVVSGNGTWNGTTFSIGVGSDGTYDGGNGSVTLEDSATLMANTLRVGGTGGYTGTLNIASDKVKITATDGVTPTKFQNYGGGLGVVNFDHHGNFTLTNQITSTSIAINALSGVTTLTGANAFGRGTTVADGATLIANNATAFGTGSVTVAEGGTLAFGNGIDALTLGGADVTIHGLLNLGIGDTITGTGNLLLDGDMSLAFSNSAQLVSLNMNDFFSGFASTSFTGLHDITATDGAALYRGTLGAGGALSFQAVPEPSLIALLCSGGLAAGAFRLYRRRFSRATATVGGKECR
jgi:hypothetical protein